MVRTDAICFIVLLLFSRGWFSSIAGNETEGRLLELFDELDRKAISSFAATMVFYCDLLSPSRRAQRRNAKVKILFFFLCPEALDPPSCFPPKSWRSSTFARESTLLRSVLKFFPARLI